MASYIRKLNQAVLSRLYGSFNCDTDIIAFHRYRFVYFALPKVANSSMKLTLGPLVPELTESFSDYADNGFTTPFSDPDIRVMLRRKHVLLCKHEMKRVKGYFSFAFVRNPWDRLVSCYTQKIAGRTFANGPESRGTTRALAKAGYYQDDLSFDDFVRAVANIPDKSANRHYRSQTAFLVDRKGQLLVEQISKFEEMDEVFSQIMAKIGVQGLSLPHLKRTVRQDYRDYYTADTRRIVGERYREDVERFGYHF